MCSWDFGKGKTKYDIWGDAVNTASRMKSTGIPNRIQISSSFKKLVEEHFDAEAGGVIEVKGKGLMETFFLLNPKQNSLRSSIGITRLIVLIYK